MSSQTVAGAGGLDTKQTLRDNHLRSGIRRAPSKLILGGRVVPEDDAR